MNSSEAAGSAICAVAAEAIRHGLDDGVRWIPDPSAYPLSLRRRAATFVTLERDGSLLGCVGTLVARDPLVVDVAAHAYAAAFEDPRLPAVTRDDLDHMCIKVSELGPLEPLEVASLEDLCASLRPGADGVVVRSGAKRATFLPSVWATLGDPDDLLAALWRKAGLDPGEWPDDIVVERYSVVEYANPGPSRPQRTVGSGRYQTAPSKLARILLSRVTRTPPPTEA